MCGGFVISGIGHPFRVRSSDTGADVSTASWSNLHYIQSPYHSGKSTGAVAIPASYCGLYSARDAALADSSCITSSSREKCRGMLHWPSKSSLKEPCLSLTPSHSGKSTKNVELFLGWRIRWDWYRMKNISADFPVQIFQIFTIKNNSRCLHTRRLFSHSELVRVCMLK